MQYAIPIRKSWLIEFHSINLQRNLGLWSKGIRCDSGTVPAAVNPEMFLHYVIAVWLIQMAKL